MSSRRKKPSGSRPRRPAASAPPERKPAPESTSTAQAAPTTAASSAQTAPAAEPGGGGAPAARERRWAPWTLAALAYAGFVVSAYLTIVHYRGYVSPCYVVQGCETVQTSRYSVVLGVPVALAGAVFFGVLFYLAVGLLRSSAVWLGRAFKMLAFLGALGVIPLFLLQAIVLKAFCSYCLLTEALMLAVWVLSFSLPTARLGREPLEAGASAE